MAGFGYGAPRSGAPPTFGFSASALGTGVGVSVGASEPLDDPGFEDSDYAQDEGFVIGSTDIDGFRTSSRGAVPTFGGFGRSQGVAPPSRQTSQVRRVRTPEPIRRSLGRPRPGQPYDVCFYRLPSYHEHPLLPKYSELVNFIVQRTNARTVLHTSRREDWSNSILVVAIGTTPTQDLDDDFWQMPHGRGIHNLLAVYLVEEGSEDFYLAERTKAFRIINYRALERITVNRNSVKLDDYTKHTLKAVDQQLANGW